MRLDESYERREPGQRSARPGNIIDDNLAAVELHLLLRLIDADLHLAVGQAVWIEMRAIAQRMPRVLHRIVRIVADCKFGSRREWSFATLGIAVGTLDNESKRSAMSNKKKTQKRATQTNKKTFL